MIRAPGRVAIAIAASVFASIGAPCALAQEDPGPITPMLGTYDPLGFAQLKRFTARRGEPLVGAFHPEELEAMLASGGLELVETLTPAQQEQRYFADRRDGLRPMPASFFAHARVSSAAAHALNETTTVAAPQDVSI